MSKFVPVVTNDAIIEPAMVMIYGEGGLGKTTWGSKAPKPYLIGLEKGVNKIKVPKTLPKNYDEYVGTLDWLLTEKHDYESVITDSVTKLEPMIWDKVCKDEGKKHIEDVSYKKGFIYALDYWNVIIQKLEKLREEKNMNIILIGHVFEKDYKDPQMSDSYSKFNIALHPKAAKLIFNEMDDVLFVRYKTYVDTESGSKNTGLGDGSRIVYTESRPGFDAKNRNNLPFEMPLNWDDYMFACQNQRPKQATDMIKFIEDNLHSLPEEIRAKAKAHFEANKENPVVLAQIEDRIKTIISTKTA